MKNRIITAGTLALALSVSAFAGSKGTLTLRDGAEINGTKLAPGEYKVTWEDSGAVTVSQGKDVKVKAQARVVKQKHASESTELVTWQGKLKSVRFAGSKDVIVLSESDQAAN
ncbi:MAG: hypothetical protein HYX26_04525 [Acidobacteriales bacterium]|nr:hypothetical protein [Terriglobales bacterium]